MIYVGFCLVFGHSSEFSFFLFLLVSSFVSASFGPAILFERGFVVGYFDSLVAGVRHAAVECVVFVSQITVFFGPAILFERDFCLSG